MTTIPIWTAISVSVGTPVLTFVGVLIAQRVTRVGATELEARSQREEVMRNLRWAAELAISDDQAKARLGLSQLEALSDSNLGDADVQAFVDAALESVVTDVAAEIDELGEDTDIEVTEGDSVPSDADPDVDLDTEDQGG